MELIKGVFSLASNIDYAKDAVVSKTIIKKTAGTITLFAFDKGQGLSPHKAPFDAMVQILDGESAITIEQETFNVKSGESIILPAGDMHALEAVTPFKMLLTMIKSSI